MSDPTLFLSLGAGVQSSVMLLRAIAGDIDRPDHVIFSDTGFEPKAVYRHIAWLRERCEAARIPLHVTQAKLNMREEFEAFEKGEKKHWNSRPPLYVLNAEGGKSLMFRQCTRDAKIRPINRKILQILGHKTRRTVRPGEASVMVGISTDEARRAKPGSESWYDYEYPLIDPLKMSRDDCLRWWEEHHPDVALPRSSCVICPYRSNGFWRKLGEDKAEAVEWDARIRKAYEERTEQTLFVHRSFKPLAEALNEPGQEEFDFENDMYCPGGCGL